MKALLIIGAAKKVNSGLCNLQGFAITPTGCLKTVLRQQGLEP